MCDDEESSVVQCPQWFLKTTQSFDQLQLHRRDQVVSFSKDGTNKMSEEKLGEDVSLIVF